MRSTSTKRRARVLVSATTVVLLTFGGTAPAHAGLLGGVIDVIDTTVDTTVDLVDDVGGLVLGDGWLVEDGQTSMDHVNDVIGAKKAWRNGYTGAGVDVALIDTGVVPVPGLTLSPVVNGPDLSLESQFADVRYLDTYGHGTHLAGIAVGRQSTKGGFRGVAPDAGLVSLKLGTYDGAVDVSQVIAAIDWVVQHRNSGGRNIRVLNLAYGTLSTNTAQSDPLSHAVENAWRNGIVVVVSAGNSGPGASLGTPATNPFVISVGASDTEGTVSTYDDTLAEFSSGGDSVRRPDLVAPGRSIVSLRDPGSFIDHHYPSARVGETLFKGSGTSQSAAVVSGAAALLLQQRPGLTPDQVKGLLKKTAAAVPSGGAAAGAGVVRIDSALSAAPPSTVQTWTASTGTGSLEAARGEGHVADGQSELNGEHTILGPWAATPWATDSRAGKAWNGGVWQGQTWIGDCWCGTSWTSQTWATATWTGQTWAGNDWQGRTWRVGSWDGRTWRQSAWDSSTWDDDSAWEGRTWRGASWLGRTWRGAGAQ